MYVMKVPPGAFAAASSLPAHCVPPASQQPGEVSQTPSVRRLQAAVPSAANSVASHASPYAMLDKAIEDAVTTWVQSWSVNMATSETTQWSSMVCPLETFHTLAAMTSGLALLQAHAFTFRAERSSASTGGVGARQRVAYHWAVQSAAPASGNPQVVQPAQESSGLPQSRQASQKLPPLSKLQNIPGGHVASAEHSAPTWRDTWAFATAANATRRHVGRRIMMLVVARCRSWYKVFCLHRGGSNSQTPYFNGQVRC